MDQAMPRSTATSSSWSLGRRVAIYIVESGNHTQPINMPHPFFQVYGAEAILPSDVQYDSPRVEAYEEEDAEKSRQLSVDLLEEERDLAAQRSAIYQQNHRRYHNR
jgi:hypothetical protein